MDVVLEVELAVAVLAVAALCDADTFVADECAECAECDSDPLATAALGAAALADLDASCRCADLRCTAVFEAVCFDADGFAVVFDGAFCAARFPAARSASVIARFETCKRSV